MNANSLLQSVIAFIYALTLLSSSAVMAASESKSSKYKTKKTVAMSQPVFKKLQEAQGFVEAEKYTSALNVLESVRKGKKRLTPYEAAQSWNLTAYVHYEQDQYQSAIKAYQRVLSQGELPDALIQSTLKTVSQLYFSTEQYAEALKSIDELMTLVEKPSAALYMLLGQTHFQLEQYSKALTPIKKAIAMHRSQGKKPKEQWLLLLRVVYHEQGDYRNMRIVLEEMIKLYPKESYLRALVGVYSELGDTKKQLTIMESLYESGFKQTSGQITNLANLYLLHGLPYKAATVLDKALNKSKRVKNTKSNYRLLSQAWYQAREDEKSIPPMQKAAKLSKTGELHVRVGQSYINLDRWKEAASAIRLGLKKGGLKRSDTAQLMLGMALFNQQKLEQASKHFAVAQNDKRSARVAGQWIAYVESELKRKGVLGN